MNKVRKDNARLKGKSTNTRQNAIHENAKIKHGKVKKSNMSFVLQNTDSKKGDGVDTEVEFIGMIPGEADDEFLDYEDDLSMEEDNADIVHNLDEMQSPIQGSQVDQAAIPGTSKDQSQSSSTDLATQINALPEEQLMQNPIIQKMMTKFFEERFKDLNPTTGLINSSTICKTDKVKTQVNGSLVKSPSDTTIYAPALSK